MVIRNLRSSFSRDGNISEDLLSAYCVPGTAEISLCNPVVFCMEWMVVVQISKVLGRSPTSQIEPGEPWCWLLPGGVKGPGLFNYIFFPLL